MGVSRPSGVESAVYGKPHPANVASQPRISEPSSPPSSRIERPMVQRPAVEKPPVQRSAAKDVPAVDIPAVDTPPVADRKVVERPPSPPSAAPQTKGCEDLHTRCEAWSKAGECERNPSFMVQGCRRSCRLCPIMSPSGTSAV